MDPKHGLIVFDHFVQSFRWAPTLFSFLILFYLAAIARPMATFPHCIMSNCIVFWLDIDLHVARRVLSAVLLITDANSLFERIGFFYDVKELACLNMNHFLGSQKSRRGWCPKIKQLQIIFSKIEEQHFSVFSQMQNVWKFSCSHAYLQSKGPIHHCPEKTVQSTLSSNWCRLSL